MERIFFMVYFTLKGICQWQFYKIRIQNNSFEKSTKTLSIFQTRIWRRSSMKQAGMPRSIFLLYGLAVKPHIILFRTHEQNTCKFIHGFAYLPFGEGWASPPRRKFISNLRCYYEVDVTSMTPETDRAVIQAEQCAATCQRSTVSVASSKSCC
jgi:hypothetical protein